ncbi:MULTISPECIES: response regulator transcription factor [Clostridia]|uniref:response regulator transcription factor n=1 Tax=Clostridia TaxID=186801 RepID=UPI000EA1BDEF|nr:MULTISPECIES: response regulator transcription factor [Clostridia]NBJ69331.1 DNA-binding response regulator [Roseburia sp. 1XD42-34]RKI78998.1 DNA-binding response regulator [Clostridium sp. 1xD42-85]
MQEKILLVEDDPSISEMVTNFLVKEGFFVIHASDGKDAMDLFAQQTFDLVLLDLMLPKRSGMECLQRMRNQSLVPVLIISAKDSDVDKALSLGFGADDYLVKPFSVIELLARVKASIRRATEYSKQEEKRKQEIIQIHELRIDIDNFQLTKNGITIKLTNKEWEILKLLIQHPTKVFTKEQIYRSIWKEEYYKDENVINVHMSRLREKIEDDPAKPKYIETLWGIGYRLGEF